MIDHRLRPQQYRGELSLPASVAPAQPGRRRSIAVVGASGFVGSATVQALSVLPCQVTAVVRRRPRVPQHGVRYELADITDLRSLTTALAGIDVVVHAASYTGPDERLCRRITGVGTENILAAAAMNKIEHVISISSIGVYGPGPFTDVTEDSREPSPLTVLSTARAVADQLVRTHGGTTVRPGFIHGSGDRWFLPGLHRILDTAQAWIGHGSALLSVIAVDELGALIAELASDCSPDDRGALFHAAHPQPVTVEEATIGLGNRNFVAPSVSCTYAEALSRATDLGLTAREIDLVGQDHTIDSTKIWARVGMTPSPSPLGATYRRRLTTN